MNRWKAGAIGVLVVCVAVGSAFALSSLGKGTGTRIEHRGNTIVLHGRGNGADLGYLPAGRYRVTVEEGVGGCAIGLRLAGADGVEWFTLIFYTNRDSPTGTTGEIPAQQYKVSTDVYFGDGLSTATPEPATDCTWTFDFTRL
jgi:hypothetical protein